MNFKKYIAAVFCITSILLAAIGGVIAYVDPFMHYHKPLPQYLYYKIQPFYMNYGIINNFDYDAMITGTSMTENFYASEADRIWGVSSIKVPFPGGNLNEVDHAVNFACKYNDDLKLVIRSLDMEYIFDDANYERYDNKPKFLYDNIVFNDAEYLFNKKILIDEAYFNTYVYTLWGHEITFDEYLSWRDSFVYGKEAVLERYKRPEKAEYTLEFEKDPEQWNTLRKNILENVIETAKKYPNVQFYYFFPPYSIMFFDNTNQNGRLEYDLECYEKAVEMILQVDNIKLFSFFDNYDLICNLDNYKDPFHYSSRINSNILQWMHDGVGLLTKENYKEHFRQIKQFYTNYDYESLFV